MRSVAVKSVVQAIGLAFALAFATATEAATIIDIDVRAEHGLKVALEAGTYRFAFIGIADGGAYDAYGLWTHQYPYTDPRTGSNCQAGLAQCRYGYQNAVSVSILRTPMIYRLASDLTPPMPSYTRFATIEAAIAAARTGPYNRALEFTLADRDNAVFKVTDTSWWDNEGGVSLLITRVPEPTTWAMLVVGFGLIGAARRRRHAFTSA